MDWHSNELIMAEGTNIAKRKDVLGTKSMKQSFMDIDFFWCEALLDCS